jgi:DNA-binding response OmpR family regulator
MDNPATILVVDDHADLLENLSLTLEAAGYNVLPAEDGLYALQILESNPVDLILADIAMPRLNGYQLYERVRQNQAWIGIPFVLLTARALDSDVRYGKELGVDDYLTKPIQPEDLLAAVRGKLRRAGQLAVSVAENLPKPSAANGALTIGSLSIDPGKHQASLGGKEIKLSVREFKLLLELARSADRVVSAQDLILVTHELETDHIEAGSLLRPLIRSLRRKMGYKTGEMGIIENVRGVGYRLVPPLG